MTIPVGKKGKPAKKHGTDIPLANIPTREEMKGTSYKQEVKLEAVKRFQGGENPDAIAKALHIANPAIINVWVRKVESGEPLQQRGGHRTSKGFDLASGLRAALQEAQQQRAERLEAAAVIVEADGPARDGAEVAKKIRSWIVKTEGG